MIMLFVVSGVFSLAFDTISYTLLISFTFIVSIQLYLSVYVNKLFTKILYIVFLLKMVCYCNIICKVCVVLQNKKSRNLT